MATDTRFDADLYQADAPERKKSGWSTCLTGCLVVFVVCLVLAVIVGFWISRNWRGWAATAGSQALKQGIEQSQLPAQEKQDINAQVDRVADAFRAGQLSGDQLGAIVQKLVDSPLMTSFVASAVELKYFAKSGLSEDEKTQGKQTLRRFLRGSIDKKINKLAMDAAMVHVADPQPNGGWKLREQVSDEDLRKFLEAAKAEADKAGIPEEPVDFDPSDEVKRIIDETMKL